MRPDLSASKRCHACRAKWESTPRNRCSTFSLAPRQGSACAKRPRAIHKAPSRFSASAISQLSSPFFPRNTGVLTVLSVESGEVLHRSRLGGNFSASPVASDGRVYLASEEGVVTVVTAEAEPEVLARIDMAESIMASPAISEGTLFVRTAGHLYAIGQ